jgi:hypothetical protein
MERAPAASPSKGLEDTLIRREMNRYFNEAFDDLLLKERGYELGS